MILPYLEHDDVFKRINFSVPWDDPQNASAFQTELNVYLNPRITEPKKKAGYARAIMPQTPACLAATLDGLRTM